MVGGVVVCDVTRRRGARTVGTTAAQPRELPDPPVGDAGDNPGRRLAGGNGASADGVGKLASPRRSH